MDDVDLKDIAIGIASGLVGFMILEGIARFADWYMSYPLLER